MRPYLAFLGCALAISLCRGTGAATVAATYTGVSPSAAFYYQLDGSVRATHAGFYNFNWSGSDYGKSIGGSLTTFCIEINQPVRMTRLYRYDVVGLDDAPVPGVGAGDGLGMGSKKAMDIKLLWAKYYDQAVLNANNAAAFQIAIWEIIYDDDKWLTAGSFQARYQSLAPVITAQTWLGDLSWDGSLPDLQALSSPTAQDQVFLAPPALGPVVVPLPAAVWAGGALLMLIIIHNIRRLRLVS